MKKLDDAVIYNEIMNDLVVEDPLGGETQADKELREVSARHTSNMRALKEIVVKDWGQIPVAPAKAPPRKRAKRGG